MQLSWGLCSEVSGEFCVDHIVPVPNLIGAVSATNFGLDEVDAGSGASGCYANRGTEPPASRRVARSQRRHDGRSRHSPLHRQGSVLIRREPDSRILRQLLCNSILRGREQIGDVGMCRGDQVGMIIV